ncbi:MAG: hypothetical protein IH831_11050, partial [Planctomycetes bacterium]|nr:hypothetical protein [Planctomycetota bacterium]
VQLHDWKNERLPCVLPEIENRQEKFSPEANGLFKYPRNFPPLLYWLLGEAKRLLEQEAETTGKELVELAAYFGLVERQIMLAGTNPPAAYKTPKLPGYAQHEQQQQRAKLDEWVAKQAEWPERQAYLYQSSYQPVLTQSGDGGEPTEADGTLSPAERKAGWLGKALILKTANRELSHAEIARKVGVHPDQLTPKRCLQMASLEKMQPGGTTSGHLTKPGRRGRGRPGSLI